MSERDRCLNELRLAGLYDEDSEYGGMVGKAVEELLDCFFKQGHSGYSAPHVAGIFHHLIQGKILSPLTGLPDEWEDPLGGGETLQNKRCGTVFREIATGRTYDIEGRRFIHKNGASFTCKEGHTAVSFPYFPETEKVVEGTPEAEPYRFLFESSCQSESR